MKKTVLFTIALLFMLCRSYGQVAFEDAGRLKNLVTTDSQGNPIFKSDAASLAEICGILANYYPDLKNLNAAAMLTTLKTNVPANKYYNPFLAPYLNMGFANGTSRFATLSSVTNAIGGLDVTNLADGLSKFLVKRAKEELFISVIERLNDPKKFPEIPILFPNTQKLMDSFDSWQYANVLNTIREAFDKDLQNILINITKLNTLSSTTAGLTDEAKKRVISIEAFFALPKARVFISALVVGDGLINGKKIPDIIHTVAGPGYIGDMPGVSTDATNAFKLLDILTNSVRSNLTGKSFIPLADIRALRADAIARNLYLGLLYAQIKQQNIVINTVDVASVVSGADQYAEHLLTNYASLDEAIKNLSDAKKKGEKDLSAYWAALFESANKFFQATSDVSLIDTRLAFPADLQEVITASSNTIAAAHDIAVKDYNAVIVDIIAFIPQSAGTEEFRKFIVKYGSFAANVVKAENSDDVQNAIESVALPVGSYSIKQKSYFNISLNGYVGYALDFSSGVNHGIYAPVGFSFNWAVSKEKKSGAFTIFGSLFDVGNLVSYHLSDNGATDGLKQEIRLESIFSPSAQLFYAIPSTPLAIGFGVRRTPKLFYSGEDGFVPVQPKTAFNISVLFDIPLFTLHNTSFSDR